MSTFKNGNMRNMGNMTTRVSQGVRGMRLKARVMSADPPDPIFTNFWVQ